MDAALGFPGLSGSDRYTVAVDVAPALALVALTALVTFSPAARVPIGVLAAMYVIFEHASVSAGALLAAIGVTLARIGLALIARRPGHTRRRSAAAQAREEAMSRWLATSPQFVRVSFLMGALPFVPSRVTFPMLGAIRAPLRWAVLGSLCGSVLVLSLTTWLFANLSVQVAGRDQAAQLLGLSAITLVIVRLVGSIDGEAWRSERKLRLREEKPPFNMSMFGPGSSDGGGGMWDTGRFRGSDDAHDNHRGSSDASLRLDDHGDAYYEGEVLGEEIVGDAGADDDDGPVGGPASEGR